jgi:hypothetical protein
MRVGRPAPPGDPHDAAAGRTATKGGAKACHRLAIGRQVAAVHREKKQLFEPGEGKFFTDSEKFRTF